MVNKEPGVFEQPSKDLSLIVTAGNSCPKCQQFGLFWWDGLGYYCENCLTPFDKNLNEMPKEEWHRRYTETHHGTSL